MRGSDKASKVAQVIIMTGILYDRINRSDYFIDLNSEMGRMQVWHQMPEGRHPRRNFEWDKYIETRDDYLVLKTYIAYRYSKLNKILYVYKGFFDEIADLDIEEVKPIIEDIFGDDVRIMIEPPQQPHTISLNSESGRRSIHEQDADCL